MDEIIETTGHNGDIIITSEDHVTYNYCTEALENGNCVRWIVVTPKSSMIIENTNNIEAYSNIAVFVLVIMLLVWFVKGIFRLIIPTRWKRK